MLLGWGGHDDLVNAAGGVLVLAAQATGGHVAATNLALKPTYRALTAAEPSPTLRSEDDPSLWDYSAEQSPRSRWEDL